jgi:diadenosine tetraphosphate (Ap4A) HIT family hydrolase
MVSKILQGAQMNIDKAIEILESGLVTQQEQEELVTMLQNIQKNARRECCNFLMKMHEEQNMHNHYHVAAVKLWEVDK